MKSDWPSCAHDRKPIVQRNADSLLLKQLFMKPNLKRSCQASGPGTGPQPLEMQRPEQGLPTQTKQVDIFSQIAQRRATENQKNE